MKLKMAENSLFAILLRKPWWISVLIAVVLALAASAMLPRAYAAYGIWSGLPFLAIGIVAAFRQWQAPSAARIAHTVERVRAMSWREFADALEQAYRSQGYEVARRAGAADFELGAGSGRTLLAAKRWKAAGTGVEALRELHAAAAACGAQESLYVTLGELSDNARQFAVEKNIRVLRGAELAALLKL